MRNASGLPDEPRPAAEPVREGIVCAGCGSFSVHAVAGVFRNPQPGSPRRFCSPACRQSAHRRRRAGLAENTPRQHRGGRRRRLTLTLPTEEPPLPD